MAPEVADSVVLSSGIRIAIRDFGGVGVGIVLIHGLSRTLVDWTVIAPLLARRHHVVAMDVRGHGKSGDGPWSWSAAVSDLTQVVDQAGMSSPAMLGHSLGGMIATMWGRDHPDSAGIINLDGHGNPRADQYAGLDPVWVAQHRAQLEAVQSQQLAALAGPLSPARVDALRAQQTAMAARLGAPAELFMEGLDRMLEVRDGGTFLRPAIDGIGRAIYDGLDQVDMFAIYREVRCPLLLVNAEPPDAGTASGPPWISKLMEAFRKGQSRDLAALAAVQANIDFQTLEGSHGLVFEQPAKIAEMTLDFLGSR